MSTIEQPVAEGANEQQKIAAETWPDTAGLRVKTILAPVDFSDESKEAVRQAKFLAKALGATIELLHVAEIDSPGYKFGSVDFPALETQLKERARELLEELAKEQIGTGAPVRTQVRSGWPFGGAKRWSEILAAAEEGQADMIVIGARGASRLRDVLLGSTAERVVRGAKCPVLVVRRAASS